MNEALETFDADWLALREPVDHATRSRALEEQLAGRLQTGTGPLRIVDLGAGSGSTLRHLAPRLQELGIRREQDWLLVDHDSALLARALATPVPATRSVATARADLGDAAALADVLAGADVVLASALLDVLRPAAAAVLVTALGALRPRPAVLFVLTVTGGASVDPALPGDVALAAAFDADQRSHGLGPDATDHVAGLLTADGWDVRRERTPWSLGPATRPLLAAWLTGWCGPAGADASARLGAGGPELRASVPHEDLLALPSADRPAVDRTAVDRTAVDRPVEERP